MRLVTSVWKSTVASVLAMAVAAPALAADPVPVKFMMDWAWQGPQAFALLAKNSGCFEKNGVAITLDRGFGSGRVPVELASGNYQMGLADLSPSIKFRAEKPETGIMAVAVLHEANPLVAVVAADGPIKTPKDFEGKKLAAPDFDAGRQLFPLFAAATGIDASKIEWISVKPELREPMLVQGQTDGITGFITSSVPSLSALGYGPEKQRVFKYKDFGVELYSTSILTTKAFAEKNPAAVKAVTACMIEGLREAVADPDKAMAALKAHEPLTIVDVEKGRWIMAIEEQISTANVKKVGLSQVDMAKLQASITAVEKAYKMEPKLKAEEMYSSAFLPAKEALMLK